VRSGALLGGIGAISGSPGVELRKAIKAKDEKRIAELTSKIGKPSSDH
jgi:hypothetical protein